MSIAVSALVHPSRTGRVLLAVCAFVQCALAVILGTASGRDYLGAPWLAAVPAGAALALLRAALRTAKTHQIDISGTGELRVTVQQDLGASRRASVDAGAEFLLPGSAVWPWLMVLRHARHGERGRVLIVWRDAVDVRAWRALIVALTVVAGVGEGTTTGRHTR